MSCICGPPFVEGKSITGYKPQLGVERQPVQDPGGQALSTHLRTSAVATSSFLPLFFSPGASAEGDPEAVPRPLAWQTPLSTQCQPARASLAGIWAWDDPFWNRHQPVLLCVCCYGVAESLSAGETFDPEEGSFP